MTDQEINKALALAIGYKPENVREHWNFISVLNKYGPHSSGLGWYVFDYRDYQTIGPIAERYDAFPGRWYGLGKKIGWVSAWCDARYEFPQLAIAMAVINRKKS